MLNNLKNYKYIFNIMNLVYSFVGRLPSYIVETIFQCRLYYQGPIYLIIDDIESEYLKQIQEFNVQIIDYRNVIETAFLLFAQEHKHKFVAVPKLGDRSLLFLRSLERFYLLQNLMKQNALENVIFIELDNVIYDDPHKWVERLREFSLAFMIDNKDRIGSGIFFAKNYIELTKLTDLYYEYISTADETKFIYEMYANAYAMKKLENLCIFPTTFEHSVEANQMPQMAENFARFERVLFDSSAYGIYLCGLDPYHTDGHTMLCKKNPGALIDGTKYCLEWRFESGLRKPFLKHNNTYISIVNLHVHSKDLFSALSKPFQNKSAIYVYGADKNLVTVTNKAQQIFEKKQNVVTILKTDVFNDIFSDVLPNQKKTLKITFLHDDTTIEIPEVRSKDYQFSFFDE